MSVVSVVVTNSIAGTAKMTPMTDFCNTILGNVNLQNLRTDCPAIILERDSLDYGDYYPKDLYQSLLASPTSEAS